MAIDQGYNREDFDRPEFDLSPETHLAQAEMAAERGEEYDPWEVEENVDEWTADAAPLLDVAEPVETDE